jgi:hypothetical protein
MKAKSRRFVDSRSPITGRKAVEQPPSPSPSGARKPGLAHKADDGGDHMPMGRDQSAMSPAYGEAEEFASTEDEATLPETGAFQRLTPTGQELVRKIARQLGILMARRDHAETIGRQTPDASESAE